jgi:hypothetical protein
MQEGRCDFPKNVLGLQRGSLIISNHALVEAQLGIRIGQPIPIGYDGVYVRCAAFTWSIEGLVDEIRAGYWKISDHLIDLSDEEKIKKFASAIELRDGQ